MAVEKGTKDEQMDCFGRTGSDRIVPEERMRDVRTDFYVPRDIRQPRTGARLIVACLARDCARAVLMDPRPLFGARHHWPIAGRSERFRCACGSRETRLSYTVNTAQPDGPVPMDAIRLWL